MCVNSRTHWNAPRSSPTAPEIGPQLLPSVAIPRANGKVLLQILFPILFSWEGKPGRRQPIRAAAARRTHSARKTPFANVAGTKLRAAEKIGYCTQNAC